MKTKTIILTFGLCVAGWTAVADQSMANLAAANAPKKAGISLASPFAPIKTENNNNGRVERVGGMSSRPWTQIVGWHPGEPSISMDAQTHEPQLHLFWIGAEPQP